MKTHSAANAQFMSFRGATAGYPFGRNIQVYKVGNKMFGTLGEDADPPRVNLKCEPTWALQLRGSFESVIPGYHMNKRHWNTLILDGSLPDDLIIEMFEHSYERVFQSLTRAERERITNLG
jgi:predicted DNA-binding protein (MmcQ/YjbR family)